RQAAVNRTVLMVEHNLSVVANLSATITVLARGEILAEGAYAAVSRNGGATERASPRGTTPPSRETPTSSRPTWARATVEPDGRRRAPRSAGPARLVWRVPRASRRRLRGEAGRGGHSSRPQRGRQEPPPQVRDE